MDSKSLLTTEKVPINETTTNPEISENDRQQLKEALKTAKPGKTIIGFTCNVCNHRQFSEMSTGAYLKGVVIIKCHGCESKHLISDHLGWFDTLKTKGTIEEILRDKGLSVDKLEYFNE